MVFSFLFRSKKHQKIGKELYSFVLTAARKPELYGKGRIPDTVDGRFDALVLHAFLVMRALRQAKPEQRLDQYVFDAMFLDLDAAVRELGTSDTRVAKRIKEMAKAFYGRSKTYHDALESGDMAKICAAIDRNLLSGVPDKGDSSVFSAKMAQWVCTSDQQISAQSIDAILQNGPNYAKFS